MNVNVQVLEFNRKYAEDIADILSRDTELAKRLRRDGAIRPTTAADVLETNRAWRAEKNATVYAVVLDGAAIGTITIREEAEHCVTIGYMLGSGNWGKGYMSDAFAQALSIAKGMGAQSVRGKEAADDQPSLNIWEKHGARFTRHGALVLCQIEV